MSVVQGSFPDAGECSAIDALLADIRANSLPPNDPSIQATLGRCSTLLYTLSFPSSSKNHWYCARAPPLAVEVATFLIRLHAYQRGDDWKQRLMLVLKGCADCVDGYLKARIRSDETYLSVYPPNTLKSFNANVDKWETETVLRNVKRSSTAQDNSLDPAPSPVVYHSLANVRVAQHPDVLALFLERTPTIAFQGWPKDAPPPGLLLLLAHPNDRLREWAETQAAEYIEPMKTLSRSGSHYAVISALARRLQSIDRNAATNSSSKPAPAGAIDASQTLFPPRLWTAFPTILRLVAPKDDVSSLRRLDEGRLDFPQLVFGHLNDKDDHFPSVLKCFSHLLQTYGDQLWLGFPPEFPQIKVDALRDNPMFERVMSSIGEEANGLQWCEPYLLSVWNSTVLSDALAKILAFMCEDMQHQRRDVRCRAAVAKTVGTILCTLYAKALEHPPSGSRHLAILSTRVNPYAKLICSIAFHSRYNDKEGVWAPARNEIRRFLRIAMKSDGRKANDLAFRLSSIARARSAATRNDLGRIPFAIHDALWQQTYACLPSADMDVDAMALLVEVVAASAHLDVLMPEVYKAHTSATELGTAYAVEVRSYHRGLETMRAGFAGAVTAFSARETALEEFLARDEVIRRLMVIIFSPSETLHDAAQEVVTQAYDVDGRDACLRAYFEKHPVPAFEGTFDALKAAKEVVSGLLEASSLSRSTVLCLTDILEALCAKPQGLLFGESQVKLTEAVSELWSLMSDVIAVIFKATPAWASVVPNQEVLTVWMRDALIFAREMVSQYDVLHDAASLTLHLASPSKGRGGTTVGKVMMAKLEEVFVEAIRWLKLTDQELLHQSVELVKLVLDSFDKAGAKPPEESVKKLRTYVGGKNSGKHEITREQLEGIRNSLAPFVDDEDDEEERLSPIAPPRFQEKEDPKRKRPVTSSRTSRSAPATSDSDSDIQYISTKKRSPPIDAKKALPKKDKGREEAKVSSSRATDAIQELMRGANISSKSKEKEKERLRFDFTQKKPITSKSGNSKPAAKSSGGQHSKMQELRREHQARAQHMQAARTTSGPKFEGSSAFGGPKPPLPRFTRKEESKTSDASESSSDEEEGGKGLAGLGKMQKSPKIQKIERRGIQVLETAASMGMKERSNAREQIRRTQLRLKPDMTLLHRMILSWSYDHVGDEPPDVAMRPIRAVPDSFSSYEAYRDAFYPLLALECWSQLAKAKEETQQQTIWKLSQRGYVDNWLDLTITLEQPLPPKWYLAETDIVLLRQTVGPTQSILAKTNSFKQSRNNVVASLRCIAPSQEMPIDSRWRVSKVFSLSTIHREFAALMGAQYYDLFDQIINPRPIRLPTISNDRILSATKTFGVNEPQAAAILGSLEMDGFALIQGPPGTGKTSTICGLAGQFLSTRSPNVTSVQPGKQGQAVVKKLLICAPSNAAIDEVAKRIHDGLRDSNGKKFVPKVVRIGMETSLNVSVKQISLDSLVEVKLNGRPMKPQDQVNLGDEISRIQQELSGVQAARKEKLEEFHENQHSTEKRAAIDDEIKSLSTKRFMLNKRLNDARDRQTNANRGQDAAKRAFRREVLREADIICCTLSGAGHESLEEFDFETVIIDEAAQSIEISSLIPLKYQCKRCILVGDPQQLAPTVLSVRASKFNYQQSLFARIQKRRLESVYLLSIQYRMHPSISILPSTIFYDGRLRDGPGMAEKTAAPWHEDSMLPPYRFFNVSKGVETSHSGHSLQNRGEGEVALALYRRLKKQFSTDGELDGRIGIVTMYRGQLLELKSQFRSAEGNEIFDKIDFNTVDGFQGQEKDIIILSCVRAGPGVTSVGFLADMRRMNVALTRSRSSLYILGNAATLERSDAVWKRIVLDAKARGCFLDETTPATFKTPFIAAQPVARSKQPSSSTRPEPDVAFVKPQIIKSVAKAASSGAVGPAVVPSADHAMPVQSYKRSNQTEDHPRPPPAMRSNEPDIGPSASASTNAAPMPGANGAPSVRPKPPRPKPDAAAVLFIPTKKRPAANAGITNAKRRLTEEAFQAQQRGR